MNIVKYYQISAAIALNQSLISIIPIFVIILPAIVLFTGKPLLFLSIPFIAYSIYSYHLYLVNRRFASNCTYNQTSTKGKEQLLERNVNLVAFLPAPTLSLLFFQPDGNLFGKLEDRNMKKTHLFLPNVLDKWMFREYGLFDYNETLLYTIQWRRNRIGTIFNNERVKMIELIRQNDDKWFIPCLNETLIAEVEPFFLDMKIKDRRGVILGRVRKGWMPVEWSHSFPDPNTPVFSIHPNATKNERLALFLLLTYYFRYYDH